MRNQEFFLGRPVSSLQTTLRGIAALDSRILPVVPDGLYGRSTHASVRSFQQTYDLPATGETDLQTWNAISTVYSSLFPARQTPVIAPVWTVEQQLLPGSSNYHLLLVQAMLTALGDFFPDIPKPSLSGTLDIKTEEGLRRIQLAGGLPVSGNLDQQTWYHLNSLYRTMTGNGSGLSP